MMGKSDYNLDWLDCSLGWLENKMETWGCSLGWSVSMRGLLASTEGWLGCSLEMREMAVMVTSAGRLGLMGCSSGSGLHEQG